MTVGATSLVLQNSGFFNARYGLFLAPRGDLVTKHLIEYGAHTRPFVDLSLSTLNAGDTVLDVGAHIGTYSIPLGRKVGPKGRLVAFEPNPATRELLRINVELNDLARTIEVVDAAVGAADTRGVVVMNRKNTGAAYVSLDDNDNGDGDGDGDETVEIVSIDQWLSGTNIDTVDFIKIDVEGLELGVLNGAQQLLDRCSPSILLEVASGQLERFGHTVAELNGFLTSRGYRFFTHIGERNTEESGFNLVEMDELEHRDDLYDVLAVHPSREQPHVEAGAPNGSGRGVNP